MFPNLYDFRAALSILFATGLCSRAVTQDPRGESPQEHGGTKLSLQKLTKGRHDFFQSVPVCCCLPVTPLGEGGISIPLLCQGPGAWLLRLEAAGTHWAQPHLSMIPLPVITLLIYVFLCAYIYTSSCVYVYVVLQKTGFTEKCESSWPQ